MLAIPCAWTASFNRYLPPPPFFLAYSFNLSSPSPVTLSAFPPAGSQIPQRVRQESKGRTANCICAAGRASRRQPRELSWKVEGSMAITDELVETLGGGGTVGLAVAAAVLVPTLYPPARRGLRGLA